LLKQCKEEFFKTEGSKEELSEEELEKREDELDALYKEIEKDFGKAPEEPDDIEEASRESTHKLESRISKLESGLDKLRDKNVAAMQRFIADGRNQAFRDELTLDLEEGISRFHLQYV
jgi:Lon protease-like protein